MRVSYSPDYWIPLPGRHPFPMGKYPALFRILREEGLVSADEVMTPREVPWEDLRRVHTDEYVDGLRTGTLDEKIQRAIGMPWSERLVRRSRLAVAGTLAAARAALEDGLAGNLAGGTHHSHPGRGAGYCVFNDVATALARLRHEGRVRRALVVDLDVHHGDGNAVQFADDEECFTFSVHGERNFPARKPPSDLDVALPDGTGDEAYLAAVARHLPEAVERSRPELVFYLAGVDPCAGDRFGRLALTPEGLARREELVLNELRGRGLATTLLLAGGYAETPEETARLHSLVYRAAAGRV